MKPNIYRKIFSLKRVGVLMIRPDQETIDLIIGVVVIFLVSFIFLSGLAYIYDRFLVPGERVGQVDCICAYPDGEQIVEEFEYCVIR